LFTRLTKSEGREIETNPMEDMGTREKEEDLDESDEEEDGKATK
jgi:hypothetical protein